ncbi:MAG: peptidase domain-containing ABC transporter [Caulobacter sp.]
MRDDKDDLWKRVFARKRLELVTQSEPGECGLACLCMVAGFHGLNYSLAELRRRFSISVRGASLVGLMNIAEQIGLAGRPLQLSLDEIRQLATPCVLHWNFNHFVVLERATKNYVEIYDPASGRRRLSYKRVSEAFTGIAMEFTRTAKLRSRAQIPRVRITDLWGSLQGLGGYLFQLVLLAVLTQAVATVSPIITQVVMDRAILRGDADLITTLAFGAIAVLLIQAAISCLQGMIGLHMGTQLSLQMKANLLRHVLNLPIVWFEKRHIGDILARFGSIDVVQRFITNTPSTLLMNATMAAVSLTFMLLYSPALSAMILTVFAVGFAVRLIYFPRVRQQMDEGITFGSRSSTVLMETIRGARSFKQYNREQERVTVWQNHQVDALNANVAVARMTLLGGAGMSLISSIQAVLIWSIGGHAVVKGTLSIGMLLAFQSFAMQFTLAVGRLTTMHFDWKTLELHLERLADVVHEDEDPAALPRSVEQTGRMLEGVLAIHAGAFRFSPQDPLVFEDFSLEIEEGEFIAIIGPTGGGKTTLLKALAGLLPLTSGQLLIDGLPVDAFGLRNYREQIGVVLQDDRLFQGSIAENVAFFDPEISMTRVRGALETACFYDEVMLMPMQLETMVGETGAALSAGQIQRVLIARALYRSPKIIFLDEGTSNLDPDTEARLTNALNALRITRVHVSHRERAFAGADRIFKVEAGKLTRVDNGDRQ